MRNVSYQTASRHNIDLTIVTETPNLADHNVTNKCWDLVLTIDGDPQFGAIERLDHPEHGPCMKSRFGKVLVKIPADKVAAVDALIGEYKTELDARWNAAREIDDKYEADHAEVLRRLNQ